MGKRQGCVDKSQQPRDRVTFITGLGHHDQSPRDHG